MHTMEKVEMLHKKPPHMTQTNCMNHKTKSNTQDTSPPSKQHNQKPTTTRQQRQQKQKHRIGTLIGTLLENVNNNVMRW